MDVNKIQTFLLKHPFLRKLFKPAIVSRRLYLKRKLSKWDQVFENLASVIICDPLIRILNIPGQFAVDCRSAVFQRVVIGRNYEPELVECVKRHLDTKRDAIDVGANVGFFSVLLASNITCGVVLAIEPIPANLRRLQHNLKINHLDDKTIVFEGVVSNMTGRTEILTAEGKEEYSTLGCVQHPTAMGGLWDRFTVSSSTLDELCSHHGLNPGFIKIDVEGAEHLVLEGARQVLRQNRPVILAELSDYLLTRNGSSAREVVNLLLKYDYEVLDPIHPSIPPGKKKFGDILCIPR